MSQSEEPFPRPKCLGDWKVVADRYREELKGWLAGEKTNTALTCFNYAAWSRCVGSSIYDCNDGAAAVAGVAQLLDLNRRNVHLALAIIDLGDDLLIGGDDQSLVRRFAFSNCLRPKEERSPLAPELKKIDALETACAPGRF